MKFLHVSDLHFGKIIYSKSMLEDQRAWITEFLRLADEMKPDAIVIAGDVYDRSAPSEDAVQLMDGFVTALADRGIPVMLIAGNHDSGKRLSFGGTLLAKQKVHISGIAEKEMKHVTLQDEYGPVTFWLMPYVFPALIQNVLGDESLRDYDTAVRALLAAQDIDWNQRNVIVAHQNVTANGESGIRGGSETMVGGVGQIDYRAFDGFEYAALGHIHAAYYVGRETVRYAGSPLCYHFDETKQPKKGPILVTIGEKGEEVKTETLEIAPLHPMTALRDTLPNIREAILQDPREGVYYSVVLTNERMNSEHNDELRALADRKHSEILELKSDYNPFGSAAEVTARAGGRDKPLEELFMEFYQERRGEDPTEADQQLLTFAAEQVRNGTEDFNEKNQPNSKAIDALLNYLMGQEENA